MGGDLPARTVGIDLAGSYKRTAVCQVDWLPGEVRIEFPEDCEDPALVALLVDNIRAGHWIGIDCPLGWPVDFVDTVVAHNTRAALPSPSALIRRSGHKVLNPLLYRMTDEVIWNLTGSRPPLSVAANLLGVVALRCARILAAVERECGRPIDRAGGPVVEVYPAATLRTWQLTGRDSYKRPQARPARRAILELLQQALGVRFAAEVAERCLVSHDSLDALLAAFATRAAALDRTHLPESGTETERAAVEGWIHLPACSPRELLECITG
ncbi:DUF429 domain-containing protein [Jatrophihabitans sp.]|uniref:DUF429 domain-containing protein n=1 Tax=Jatrophihabitans sp. TaxID=1932789 RepID=UPI002BC937D2|nr:DUF429 domain-containing protein [Jatrophihabitans sp.]